jgi:hypothetical protein
MAHGKGSAQGFRCMAHGKSNWRKEKLIVYKRRGIYMGKFQDLKVWQRAKDLAVYIYKLTGKGDFTKDFSLKDQIRKAAVSMPSNIAEGNDLRTDKQAVNYFYIA